MGKVPFSSPQPTGAIFSQFYIALETCFEMISNDSVFIETDGDVSVFNNFNTDANKQIEVKEYFEPLTDKHTNFWNTLNNWMHINFKHTRYSKLIISTTQEIGVKSRFVNWNFENKEARKKILNQILIDAINDLKKRQIIENKKVKPKDLSKPESLLMMENILKTENAKVLDEILNKVFISSKQPKRNEIQKKLIDKYLKNIPEENKVKVLNGLFGFIINEEKYNEGWEVTYDEFQFEFQSLTEKFVLNSRLFPIVNDYKNINTEEQKDSNKYLFVKKIEDIEYNELITESLKDYWFTFKTISTEFNHRKSSKDSIQQFQENLKNTHNPLYRKASRECSKENIINDSKGFYDTIMGKESPNFELFNDTPIIFKNGMYHILANEEAHKLSWKLKPENNE